MAKRKRKSVYSGVGGQAVLEGVMMKNKEEYAIAIRKADGSVDVSMHKTKYDPQSLIRKIPFIRGVLAFVDSLTLGMDILTYSADVAEEDVTEEEETAGDRLLKKLFGAKAEAVVMGFTVFMSLAIAILLFMVLPYAVSELAGKYLQDQTLVLLLEGMLRILVFLVYVAGIALMKDIKRLYMYHGAEHKCINCVESGRPLTVKNVRRSSRFHKRCGTSFMIFIVLIGIVLCFFIRTDSKLLRIAYRLALVPVIAGISYELLKLAGSKDSIFLSIISAPGLWMQRITTKEPDDDMIEVAIAATEAVFDWESFQEKHFKRRMVKKMREEEDGRLVDTGDETMEISVIDVEEYVRNNRE